ncbi:hypothetical protein [Arthrobacter sp. Helios]|uniref:hypothetical protein n=1 Tax=Arthrobacter sp. Helios TaxID=2828862 RepID=UPI0020493521|nr:hypothetical protein [Arthrobacter sp. Helios]UPO75806.1 hypothetical protein ArtHe_10520 [Arthrobacter sp. Helios]
MGEFILVLAVAAAGFTVGRFSTRKDAAARNSTAYGRGLPHPAQIFEEGYQAGLLDAASVQADTAAGAGYTMSQGLAKPQPQTRTRQQGRSQPQQSAIPQQSATHQQRAQSPGSAGRQPAPPPPTWAPAPAPAGFASRAAAPSAFDGPAAPAPVSSVSAPSSVPAPRNIPVPPNASAPPSSLPVQPRSPRPPAPPRPRTESELAADKRRRDLRNINITLYSASLLLVAAAALFIGISIPEEARFAGIVLLTALFYSSGLVIHSRRKSLRPAAVAFTGTGLALIPVVGLALHNFLLHDAALAWLATSLVGTAAFAYAAARLDSRVVTYLALTFLLSTALASGAAVRSGIVWYFVFTVLLATLVSLAAVRRPGWLRNVYLDAFVRSHRYLVPATAAAALLTAAELGWGPLSVLFLAIAGYYAVLVWQGPAEQALVHSYGVRAAATAGLVSAAHYFLGSVPLTLLTAVALLAVQAAALFVYEPRYAAAARQHTTPARAGRYFHVDAAAVLGLQFLAGVLAALVFGLDVRGGNGNLFAYAGSVVLVLAALCAAAWKFRGAAEPAAGAALLLGVLPRVLTGQAPLWPLLLALAMLTGYTVLRAGRASGDERGSFVLAARCAGILLVPLAVYTVLESQAPDAAWTWTLAGGIAAVAANQAVSAVRLAAGRAEKFPNGELASSICIGIVLASALRFVEAPASVLALSALWVLVGVNVLSSLLRRPEAAAAAPAGFAAAAVLGAGMMGLTGYELLTAAALGYCALQMLKFSPQPARGVYLAAAQALFTLLTGLVGADLGLSIHGVFTAIALSLAVQHVLRIVLHRRLAAVGLGRVLDWGTLVALAVLPLAYYAVRADAEAGTGTVLLLIAAISAVTTQAVSALVPNRAAAPGRSILEDTAEAAALALLLTLGLRLADAPAPAPALAGLWAAFSANLLTAVLHRGTRLALAAPAGLLAAALLGAGLLGLRGYQLLFAAALAYCVVLLRDRGNAFRGAYLAAAQVLGSLVAALVAADLVGHINGFFIALAVSSAAAQILRTLLHRRVEPLGLAEPSRWGGLAVLALLPLTYAAVPGPAETEVLLALILTAAATALFTQCSAAAGIRRKAPLPNAAVLTVSAAVAVLAAELAVRSLEHPQTGWTQVLIWAALGANAATALMLRPGRWEGLAAGGFAAAALAGAGVWGLRSYELLLLLAVAYGGYLVTRRSQPNRGHYLLGVQILAAVQAGLLAADAGAGMHGVFAAAAVVLAAAQAVRAGLEPRLGGIGFAAPAQWTTMALLASAPVVYTGYAWAAGTGAQRDVVVAQLLLLLAVAAAGFARWRAAAFLYPGIYALGALPLLLTGLTRFSGQGVLPGPVLGPLAAGLVLTALAAAALAGEARPALALPVRTALLTAAAAYPAAVLLLATEEYGLMLTALSLTALAAVFLTVSYTRTRPWLAVGVPPLLCIAALAAVGEFQNSVLGVPLPQGYGYLWPAWAAALLLQALRMFISLADGVAGRQLRSRIMGSAAAFALVAGSVPAMGEWNHSALAGSLTLLAALALAVREAPDTLREQAAQAAVLPAALAVQRMGWYLAGDPLDAFWSVQYWALVLAGLAAWQYLRKRESSFTFLLGASAVILSGSGLTTIGSGGTAEQLWALVAHAGLLAFGLLASRRLFTIWGAAGVAFAVLWYLRGYTFLLLALLAAGLIALAVWRLTKVRSEPEEVSEKEESRS